MLRLENERKKLNKTVKKKGNTGIYLLKKTTKVQIIFM